MKCYKRLKYALIAVSLIIITVFFLGKLDGNIFVGHDFLSGFFEGFIVSSLVALGLMSIKVVFFSKDKEFMNGIEPEVHKLLFMVGAASLVGSYAVNTITPDKTEANIMSYILIIQCLVYYGLYLGKLSKKKLCCR